MQVDLGLGHRHVTLVSRDLAPRGGWRRGRGAGRRRGRRRGAGRGRGAEDKRHSKGLQWAEFGGCCPSESGKRFHVLTAHGW